MLLAYGVGWLCTRALRQEPCMETAADSLLSGQVTEPRGICRKLAHAMVRRICNDVWGTIAPATPNIYIVRIITLLAAVVATATAAIAPTASFLVSRERLHAELQITAEQFAAQVAAEARRNPAFWNALADSAASTQLDDLEIARMPGQDNSGSVAEQRRVLSGTGHALINLQTPGEVPRPTLVSRVAVRDGDSYLGDVEVVRSLRPAALLAFSIALVSSGVGILIFLLLRVVPLRLLAAAIEHASFLSAHDLLTGLPNRRLFHDRLSMALTQGRRSGGSAALFYIDLDNFKTINDLLGHPAGDATLKTVAGRLAACLRASDTLARLGGDEFAIVQPMLRRPEDADVLAHRLLAAMEQPIDLDGQPQPVGLSIGIALYSPAVQVDPDQLMKQADIALYQAKHAGRGRRCFFSTDMNDRLQQRNSMEIDLRAAVSGDRFVLQYQPQVELATGRILGAEALLRWMRPGHGMVPPGEFISLAEDTGLIVPIGLWVLREACLRATRWPDHIGIAVNVSPVQLRGAGFSEAVLAVLEDTGLPPERLELEMTESVLMQDTAETLATLRRLSRLGIRLAMDDFGTGYSSLGYLQKFRFDRIKIDRSFVSRLGQDVNAEAIVRAVVGMTDALGVRAIAEGVETSEQAEVLRNHGCPEVQGYLYSRPLDAEAYEELLRVAPLQDAVRAAAG